MSIIYGRPAFGRARIGGEINRSFNVSNASTCAFVGLSQSGSAFFRNTELNGLAISEYFSTNLRYTFAVPRKEISFVTIRGNTASANAFGLSTATDNLPGVIT